MAEADVSPGLVVVGSSAGGIDALVRLTSGLPKEFNAPIVVAQHLDPHRASHLEEILSRHSVLPIHTVSARQALEPGIVYLVPSNRHVEITDHSVRLVRNGHQPGPQPSIDLLFESAAKRFGERLIAVVLSGTGSDGAAGARVVHEAGGTIIIQDPETAAFPGMPRSLAPAIVDISTDAEKIGPILHDLVNGTKQRREPDDEQAMQALFERLRARYGVDFGSYRRPTIARRLQRRLSASGVSSIQDYQRYIHDHPDEEQRLLSTFLIKVTDFFRDPRAFAYLRERVIPGLIERARLHDEGLRIWSAGCATGEEAYSLALLVAEALDGQAAPLPVRIFATDLDASAAAYARRGIYPSNALKNVPPELVERYFVNIDGEYEIDHSIREMMLFGQHDLSQMPPFPHIDLLLCRNVLMYFTPDLQRRVLEAFAFALRNGGYLMLGSAETTRPLADFFTVEQTGLKLFRRIGGPVSFLPSQFSAASTPVPMRAQGEPRQRPTRPFLLPESSIGMQMRVEAPVRMGNFPHGVVMVDRRYDVRFINVEARRLLGIHGLAVDEDLVHLLQSNLGGRIRTAIDTVLRDGRPVSIQEVAVDELDTETTRHIAIDLVGDYDTEPSEGPPPRVLLVLSDVTEMVHEREAIRATAKQQQTEMDRLLNLVHRAEETNQRLLSANEELAANEESLRASNEEALAASAEAQAATEELETYAEELQATTEELETLNEELKATVEELTVSNADLDARAQELSTEREASDRGQHQLQLVLGSMSDALVVVDAAGRPLLTNAAYDALHLGIDTTLRNEAGQELSPADSLLVPAGRGESFVVELLLSTPDGDRRIEAIGRPVESNRFDLGRGVVSIRDITERSMLRMVEQFASLATHELRAPLTAAYVYIELLTKAVASVEPGDNLRHMANQAMAAVHRLGDQITDLVDVQRLENGKLSIERAPIDIVDVTVQIVTIAQVIAKDQQIEVDNTVESLSIDADRRRIEQVLLNLLTNAITYAPSSDRIDVRVRRERQFAVIEVQDYGPGIPAADVPRLFSRFFQIERRTRPGHPGLGLGLYIAKEIVTAHGGTIDVTTHEGAGTTFTVRLPIAPDPADARGEEGAEPSSTAIGSPAAPLE